MPVSVVVAFVAAAAIPALVSATKPVIDYAGMAFIGLGAAGLTLATSWGGTLYPWGSPTIIGLSMQVLVLIAQNTSNFEDLGVATSGVTFFRTIGSSFGR